MTNPSKFTQLALQANPAIYPTQGPHPQRTTRTDIGQHCKTPGRGVGSVRCMHGAHRPIATLHRTSAGYHVCIGLAEPDDTECCSAHTLQSSCAIRCLCCLLLKDLRLSPTSEMTKPDLWHLDCNGVPFPWHAVVTESLATGVHWSHRDNCNLNPETRNPRRTMLHFQLPA